MGRQLFQITFPPQFEPFESYLAGPYLKSLLARYGVSMSFYDANIHFYEWLISLATRGLPWPTGASYSVSYLREHVPMAVNVLQRGPDLLPEYRWAINVVDECLRAISPEETELGLAHLRVNNRYSSADLRAYVDRPDNLFCLYFQHVAEGVLGSCDVSTYLLSAVVIDQLPAAIVFAREIKRRRPHARVIIGGPLVSRLYRRLSQIDWVAQTFDAIVPGEGYRALPAALGLEDVYTGHVTPDFSDLDLDKYWSCRRVLPYIIAHGCKWGKCAFCSHHLTYDGYRASLIAGVINDLEALRQKHNAEYISFSDEFLTPAQLEGLSAGLLARRVDLKWSTFARAEAKFCDPEFVSKLYAAGCRILMFGFESASQRVLDAMRKGTRADRFRSILETCKKANIAVRLDFMIGFPAETEEDVQATYDFIRQNRDVIDTPFSSYAVGVFELRGGIPVLEAADQFGIRKRNPLRGDLDDQYEFESSNGLSREACLCWREEFIRYSKLELNMEMIAPQNKTHQLVLKDLYDQGVLKLPFLRISPDCFTATGVELARGVEVVEGSGAVRVVNHANGGELEISPQFSKVLQCFKAGRTLADAFRSQTIWNERTFGRFADFLMRNDYIYVYSSIDAGRQVTRNESEVDDVRVHAGHAPKDLWDYMQQKT